MAGACRHDCWHRATSPTTTTRVARLTSGTYGTCSGNYWFPWWFLIHHGLHFIRFISTFCYTNVATEIHGFILLAAFRINPLSRSSEPWLMLGRSKKGLGSTAQFFDPSPTGTMVATATANGCGIMWHPCDADGECWLSTGSVGNCTRFLSDPSESLLGPVFRFVLRMEHWNNSKNYHIMVPVFYLFLLNYSISSLIHIWFWKATNIRTWASKASYDAPYASSPLRLGLLSASSLEARTTTLGIVSCSC